MNLYQYVGSGRIAERVQSHPKGFTIRSQMDVRDWIKNTIQQLTDDCVTATYVIDQAGVLLIADRRSEHVACAGGQPVRSAGEITFAIYSEVIVESVSNQSTGYCPEPETWPRVAEALSLAGIKTTMDGFTLSCNFRRCPNCESLSIVKSDVFECCECGGELPQVYNVK